MRVLMPSTDGARVLLGGHRGDRKHYPENTMPAFRAMAEMGADVIETDVRMTKDGHLVLIHDRDVARTTNGQGAVREMTLAELRALDAGSWKDPAFAGERIPTVEEFLDFVSGTDLLVNWELKEYPTENGDERAFACVDRLVALIDRYGLAPRSIMNSFSERLLEYVAKTYPGRFAIHGYINCDKAKDKAEKPLETFLDWAAIWRKTEEAPAGFAEDYEYARKNDVLCCILVNDVAAEYRAALDLGCRMFTSDDPAAGLAVLRQLGER